MEKEKITPLQLKWVFSRGGRRMDDVFIDENDELFIYMTNARQKVKIYIPSDWFILKEYHIVESKADNMPVLRNIK